jgi:ABC-type Fe3+ transport system permease subunit
VLEFYQLNHLNLVMTLVGVATVVAYASYAFSAHARELFDTTSMPWTIPFIVIGIGRFLQLSGAAGDARSPTDRMVRDVPFIINIVGWGLLCIWLIYLRGGAGAG